MATPVISLESIAVPGSPIKPISASAKSFANNYAKLTEYGVPTLIDQKTISILGLMYELAAQGGGTDYRTNLTQLIQDAYVYTGGISNLDFAAASAVVRWNAGLVANAAIPSDIPTMFAATRPLRQLSELQLDRIITMLLCQLQK